MGRLCQKIGEDHRRPFSRQAIAAIAETTFRQCGRCSTNEDILSNQPIRLHQLNACTLELGGGVVTSNVMWLVFRVFQKLWFFFSPHTAISSVYREWSEEEKIYRKPISLSEYALLARSLARLLWGDRKATITQYPLMVSWGRGRSGLLSLGCCFCCLALDKQ